MGVAPLTLPLPLPLTTLPLPLPLLTPILSLTLQWASVRWRGRPSRPTPNSTPTLTPYHSTLQVGVGALAGSTIMLLTVPWGGCIFAVELRSVRTPNPHPHPDADADPDPNPNATPSPNPSPSPSPNP